MNGRGIVSGMCGILPAFPDPFHPHFFFLMFTYDSEIVSSIYQGLENLNDTNAMLHDYWVSELFTEEGDIISEMWNGDSLKQIETDVMHQMCL